MRTLATLLTATCLLVAACGEAPPPAPAPREPAPAPAPPAPAPAASDEAKGGAALLDAITNAERTLAYSGYKTAVHGAGGTGRRTRMRVSRLDDGRMFLEMERGGETSRRWVVRARHRWIDDPSLLLSNYDVVVAAEPEHDVAWRAVQRIDLRPRRAGRPSLTLLVDTETRLVLGERLTDHDGVQRFAWQFDTIEYGAPELDVDEAEIVSAPDSEEAGEAAAEGAVLTPGAPPAGFERVATRHGADGTLVEYWSDGLAAFAFRQAPAHDLAGAREGELERRSCSGRSSVSGTVEGMDITLLGNLPVDELEAVAASLHARP